MSSATSKEIKFIKSDQMRKTIGKSRYCMIVQLFSIQIELQQPTLKTIVQIS